MSCFYHRISVIEWCWSLWLLHVYYWGTVFLELYTSSVLFWTVGAVHLQLNKKLPLKWKDRHTYSRHKKLLNLGFWRWEKIKRAYTWQSAIIKIVLGLMYIKTRNWYVQSLTWLTMNFFKLYYFFTFFFCSCERKIVEIRNVEFFFYKILCSSS